jgi:ArsR family metal-binding transcriptional regulator
MKLDDQLIASWDLQLQSPDCKPGADTRLAKVRLSVDISKTLPYLNAALSSAKLCADGSALIWKDVDRSYALRAYEISIAPVQDSEDARTAAEEIVKMVNDIWRRRDELTADFTYREPPNLLEIYKLLPRINCRKCGRATCMAFAGDLREGRAKVVDCQQLLEPGQEQDRERLQGLLS